MGTVVDHLRAEVARCVVSHLVETSANLATPADPMAKLRREILRGLRGSGK
ncbi:MAG: hypothetical protein WDA16_00945 [Candidatus Thermoplasmatota archaeon]